MGDFVLIAVLGYPSLCALLILHYSIIEHFLFIVMSKIESVSDFL